MNLERFRKAYYNGDPLISDAHYDALVELYGEDETLGDDGEIPHYKPMFSLKKIWDDDEPPIKGDLVKSPKLDGAAISLLYGDGFLVKGLTRGDGVLGKDISDKVIIMDSIPNKIPLEGMVQITGEVVSRKDAKNARNTASGAFGLKNLEEFKERELYFIAYSFYSDVLQHELYTHAMGYLNHIGFETVLTVDPNKFRTDGTVYRLNNNLLYEKMGNTAKHPRGAYAHKQRKDVELKETTVLDVIWNTGATGKVTPVVIVKEVVIDDAKINRLTLHNVGYVEQLDLDIGDTVLITRSGGVIPKILGNVTKEILLYA